MTGEFCWRIVATGVVQGVGFRPFVFRLATEMMLPGTVENSTDGVIIRIRCDQTTLDRFLSRLRNELPPAADIRDIVTQRIAPLELHDFRILPSSDTGTRDVFVPPDIATCCDCLRELRDPSDPRHRYPLINCTNCGPRWTIIEDIPYDRPLTSMKAFPMCRFCEEQYEDPTDRRFHAQPVACPQCGPILRLTDPEGKNMPGDPIELARKLLRDGKLLAIKGLGGFHLACDAGNIGAIQRLRALKNRPAKPLAVMVHPDCLEKLVEVSEQQRKILSSPQAPVLILPHRGKLPEILAPGLTELGVFLPYTPIQHMLLDPETLPWVVMTSANRKGEPIAREPSEIDGLWDFCLTHDRQIVNRVDDPVLRAAGTRTIMLRRARGYAPLPHNLPASVPPLLATGAEMKLGFILAAGNRAFASPHLGDGPTTGNIAFYEETLDRYKKLFGIKPQIVLRDHHPDLWSSRFANSLGLPVHTVQHHHAHMLAVMAEHGLTEPVAAVVYDGTGLGDDGAIWGGEIFTGDAFGYNRVSHLQEMPLPGGDAAVQHPARITRSWLKHCGFGTPHDFGLTETESQLLDRQLETGTRVFRTTSMGRLFDCVSVLLGYRGKIRYDGEPAILLEQLALRYPGNGSASPSGIGCTGDLPTAALLERVLDRIKRKEAPERIAWEFHRDVASITAIALGKIGFRKVCLCGGVFQNRLLLVMTTQFLEKKGFTVFVPELFPPNDAAIPLGQTMAALKGL